MPPGMRKVQKVKPPKPRPGLDDKPHRERIKKMACVLRGRTCKIGGWRGTYPKKWVEEEYKHICIGPVDPHHTDKKSQRGHDWTCVPICRGGHDEAEKLGNDGMKARWGIALPVIASTLAPKS